MPKRPTLQKQIDALVGRVAAVELVNAAVIAPIVGTPASQATSATGTIEVAPPAIMPPVPPEFGTGAVVRRKGLSAEQTTTVLNVSPTLIYVEMADSDERKLMWAPWSLFDLVKPAP